MTPIELLRHLRDLGVVLTPTCTASAVSPAADASGKTLVFGLHIDAPAGVLTPVLREALRIHKPALLDLVEGFAERTALGEYDGGLSREDAERFAWDCVLDQYAGDCIRSMCCIREDKG